jgi:hypothetical protein
MIRRIFEVRVLLAGELESFCTKDVSWHDDATIESIIHDTGMVELVERAFDKAFKHDKDASVIVTIKRPSPDASEHAVKIHTPDARD